MIENKLATEIPVPDDYREQIARWRNRGVTSGQLRAAARETLEVDDVPLDTRWLKFATLCWDLALDKTLIGRMTDTRIDPNIPEEN